MTITMTITNQPSRSKGTAWARIGAGESAQWATTAGRQVEVDEGRPFVVHLGADLRKPSGVRKERDSVSLIPEAGACCELEIGSPSSQALVVRVDGAREA